MFKPDREEEEAKSSKPHAASTNERYVKKTLFWGVNMAFGDVDILFPRHSLDPMIKTDGERTGVGGR